MVSEPTWRVLEGDARNLDVEDKSVHVCLLSVPYWGLRNYGTEPVVWGGQEGCAHEWELITRRVENNNGLQGSTLTSGAGPERRQAWHDGKSGQVETGFCHLCGAWRGSLGLEPRLDQWLDNLVSCAREWRRVLRDDGTLWVNCGDAYAGSGAAAGGNQKQTNTGSGGRWHGGSDSTKGRHYPPVGLKEKDLIGLPWRLAFALQADGWYLRSAICWAKGIDWLPNERAAQDTIRKSLQKVREEAAGSLFGISKELDRSLKRAEKAVDRIMTSGPCMPESVRDRCTSSYEMLFMFSKQERYYFDQTAIRVGLTSPPHARGRGACAETAESPFRTAGADAANREPDHPWGDVGGRNPRSVWLLWRCNTEPTGTYILPSGEECSHFAAWPSRLVRRILLCATSEAGVCGTCGSPWERVIQKPDMSERPIRSDISKMHTDAVHISNNWAGTPKSAGQQYQNWRNANPDITLGWKPSCTCHGSPISGPIPCEHCRGTGHQRIGIDYEGKWEEGDEQSASRRLAANCRAARQHGAPHDQSFSVPTAVFAGDPCPHCTCPDCGGTGTRKDTRSAHTDSSYETGTTANRLALLRQTARQVGDEYASGFGGVETGNPCPTCSGLGSLGYLSGPVWPQDTLDDWPRVPATVLDPMAGSGTTLRAARDLGLSAIGNDLSPQYVRLMRARMEAYPEDIPTKGRTKGDKEKILLSLFEAMGVNL